MKHVDYCEALVKRYRYGDYLTLYFTGEQARPASLAIIALDAELADIPLKAKEELTAQIRYAWWQESLEAWQKGEAVHEHPVLMQLARLLDPNDKQLMAYLLELIGHYRQYGKSENSLMACPQAHRLIASLIAEESWQKKYEKALDIVRGHMQKYGFNKKLWLFAKLLFV